MSKISPNMIRNICSVKSVTDMFINFDKNKTYFDEGTKEEYLSDIKDFIYKLLNNHIDDNTFILEKDTINSIIRLFSKYYCKTDEEILTNPIFSLLKNYKTIIEIAIVRRDGPCSFDNADLRNTALEVAGVQLDEIDEFFKKTKYKQKYLEALEEFKKYTDFSKRMSKKSYEKFCNLIEISGVDIPQEYVNLFFREAYLRGENVNKFSVRNATESMVHNLAKSKNASCLFEVKNNDMFTLGIYYNGIITISERELNYFCQDPKKTMVKYFETLFHEFRHLMQDIGYRENRRFSYDEIKMLKDDLLYMCLNTKFKSDNYPNLSYELDAREMSKIYARRYFNTIGLKLDFEVDKRILRDRKNHKTDSRIVDIKMVPVDHLFDEFYKNISNIMASDYATDILESYPILNLMYDQEGNRYSTLDLLKMKSLAKKELEEAQGNQKEELKIKIHNLNEIINHQDLSFVNLVADFKEMVSDTSLEVDLDEKVRIMNRLYRSANKRNKVAFRDLSYFVERVTKNKVKEINKAIESTLKTGNEMLGIFKEMLDDFVSKLNGSNTDGPRLTNRAKKNKSIKD